jgi:hypothetical protein
VNEIVASPLPPTAATFVGASGTVAGVIVLLVLDWALVPIAFVAVTVNVYVVPFDKPVIVIGEVPPVAVNPPTLEVTVYPVITDPPFDTGAVNVTVACPLPLTAVTFVGASGTVDGVTALLAPDAILAPEMFVAVTVNVYEFPFVNPVTVMGEEVPVALKPPVFEVTVYRVIDEPPFDTGAVNEIVACPLPLVADTPVGAFGTVDGVTELLVPDEALVPFAFVAVTVNVYVVPFVKPVTVIGVDPPVPVCPSFVVTV